MNKSTILVIEDNKDMRENTAEILELSNYNVLMAENGKIGIELARNSNPDLILCDIAMPELDGYGVLRAIENMPEMIGKPFIFMTAKSAKSDFRKGMDLGADDYFIKPFSGDDLLKIVSSRLKKSLALLNNNKTADQKEHNNGSNNWNSLFEHRIIKKIRNKDMLYMEGDSPNYLYFVVRGKIKVFKSNEAGKEYIVNICKEGDFLGHIALLENNEHREYAMAMEPCEVLLIPKQDFCQLINSDTETAMKFIKLLSSNYADAEEKLLQLAYDSARKRVAEAIIFISKKYKSEGNEDLTFTMNRENISSLSGISPESVSRNLTDFKEEGLITTLNGCIKILNLKRLESLKN